MAGLSEYLVVLVIYHLIFFYWAYTKPYTLATSELLSTFFPSWLHGGKNESYYWYKPTGHPVLSEYYPFSKILSYLARRTKSVNDKFTTFVYFLTAHFAITSIAWYFLLSNWFNAEIALFGSITFTYQTYHLKQQPCIVYTLSWFPVMLLGLAHHSLWLSSVAIGMILLAGYYPLSMYLLPCGFLLFPQVLPFLLGLVIGLPQLIKFIKYLPKTVRATSREDVKPNFWEYNYYIGIVPIILLITNLQWRYLWILVPIVISYLLRNYLPRVYQRAWIISAYIGVYFSLLLCQKMDINTLFIILILQSYDLWRHRQAMVTRPFNELQKKPSLAFDTKLTRYLEANLGDTRVSGLPWPIFTGLINKIRTVGYRGGMRLNLMEKHGEPRLRVKYTYSRKKLDWKFTGIKNLYFNPSF